MLFFKEIQVQLDQSHWPCHVEDFIELSMIATPRSWTLRPQRPRRTATLIAAGVGLASTGATTAMSFSQANKQKKLQKEAEVEADKAMAKARASL